MSGYAFGTLGWRGARSYVEAQCLQHSAAPIQRPTMTETIRKVTLRRLKMPLHVRTSSRTARSRSSSPTSWRSHHRRTARFRRRPYLAGVERRNPRGRLGVLARDGARARRQDAGGRDGTPAFERRAQQGRRDRVRDRARDGRAERASDFSSRRSRSSTSHCDSRTARSRCRPVIGRVSTPTGSRRTPRHARCSKHDVPSGSCMRRAFHRVRTRFPTQLGPLEGHHSCSCAKCRARHPWARGRLSTFGRQQSRHSPAVGRRPTIFHGGRDAPALPGDSSRDLCPTHASSVRGAAPPQFEDSIHAP